MTMSIRPSDSFTPAAAKRWSRIPEWAQKEILDNVFCGQCLASVPIVLETAEMMEKDLILSGKCKHCGKEVRRVVKPRD
jgi:hypothetical protein